jgi:outer membrane protein insertion porin family
MSGARIALLFFLLVVAVCVGGCREEGDVRIKSLTFNGVEQIDKKALQNALATKAGSRLPWGKKTSFDRAAFQADLERIRAFYLDRGFPDARVRSFDVQLNDAQDEVRIVVDITEGEPITVDQIQLTGFDVLSDTLQQSLHDTLPLQPGRPLDRQLAVATRDRALNVLKDEGYPYATVAMTSQDVSPKRQRIVLAATPGTLAHIGVIDVRGEKLQTVEEVEALGAAGAKMIDPHRIALNPDCGFAPDSGEPPTIDEAFEKLQRLCIAARNLRAKFA